MDCAHPEECRVNDHSSGDQICTACAQVLEAFAFETLPAWQNHAKYDDACVATDKKSVADRAERIAKRVRDISRHVKSMGYGMRLTEHVVDVAVALLAEVVSQRYTVRDGSVRQTAASALYYACRVEDVDRAEVEIAANCGLTLKQLTVSNKLFRRALASTEFGAKVCAPANPLRLIPRFVEALCAGSDPVIPRSEKNAVRARSEDLGIRVMRLGVLEGKSPECCCIAFIYRTMLDLGFPTDVVSMVCVRCGLTPNTVLSTLSIMKSV